MSSSSSSSSSSSASPVNGAANGTGMRPSASLPSLASAVPDNRDPDPVDDADPPMAQEAVRDPILEAQLNEKRKQEEVLARLPKEYYDPEFDPLGFTLSTMPAQIAEANQYLNTMLAERNKQLKAINSQIADRVFSNYDAFVKGMVHIRQVGYDLNTTANLCQRSRIALNSTNDQLTSKQLEVIAKTRKQKILQHVVGTLVEFKKLQKHERSLRDAFEDADYPRAIKIVERCESMLHSMRRFSALQTISSTISGSFELINDKLSVSIMELTRNFNGLAYGRVLEAYKMLGKTGVVLGMLEKHFTEGIKHTFKDVVYAHVLLTEENAMQAEILKPLEFRDLCKKIQEKHVSTCLKVLLEYLVDLILSHYMMFDWHVQQESEEKDPEKHFTEIRKGLERSSKTMWDEMSRDFGIFISVTPMPQFKIDQFLDILENVNKFIEIGEDFSNAPAKSLRSKINHVSTVYFRNYHRKKMEDLVEMLDNEMWVPCGVNEGYSINDEKEFRQFMTAKLGDGAFPSSLGSPLALIKESGNPFATKTSSTPQRRQKYQKNHTLTPAPVVPEPQPEQEVEDEALLQDYVYEDGMSNVPSKSSASSFEEPKETPILTAVSINIIRLIGQYLQMMRILHPIAYEVFSGINQLFQYYLYTVYSFFGRKDPHAVAPPPRPAPGSSMSSSLFQAIVQQPFHSPEAAAVAPTFAGVTNRRIKKALQQIYADLIDGAAATRGLDGVVKIRSARLSPLISFEAQRSYGLYETATAVESLVFFADSMNQVRVQINRVMSAAHNDSVVDFYSNAVDLVSTIRLDIYHNVVEHIINMDTVMTAVVNQRYDIRDPPTNHSPYVDSLVKEFARLIKFLEEAKRTKMAPPEMCHEMLTWELKVAINALVEAISNVRRCSSEGRSLMGLDSYTFQSTIKKIANLKVIPNGDLLDNYVRAFFIPENEFVQWVKDNQNKYTKDQIYNVLNLAGTMMNKKLFKDIQTSVRSVLERTPS